MPFTLRPAAEADQRTIRRMIREAGINPMDLRWANFLVAEEDGAIVGIGQVKTHRDGTRELASMAVLPKRQSEGIGSAVIKALIEGHRDQALHLTCRRELAGYYERFGFQRVTRPEYPPYFARILPVINLFARLAGTEIILMRRPG